MSKKEKIIFKCQSCDNETLQWMGKCPNCGDWDSLIKEKIHKLDNKFMREKTKPVLMNSIKFEQPPRIYTGIKEFDRVLGGGIVNGSLILIGGDPGIGKSTLMLQVFSNLANSGKKALYISGEESIIQIKMRGKRLGSDSCTMLVAAETNLDLILGMAEKEKPDVMVVDSIQTAYNPNISSTPGSVTQIREACIQLMNMAKQTGISIFLVGHVTKVGAIAGPRIMEHMVDTVLYFEGDKNHMFKILRAVKNRFGSTNEIGVFEMKTKGLAEISNPSAFFLSERSINTPGSVVSSSMEGTRPILVEIQGLVSNSGFGTPRRTVLGLDQNRVALIAAVMEKRLGINLSGLDIFMNVTGGVKVIEPAVDIGIALALASSFFDKPVFERTALIGEIGLTGEIRTVSHADQRIKEAEKMGFTTCIVPKNTQFSNLKKIKIKQASSLKQIIDILF